MPPSNQPRDFRSSSVYSDNLDNLSTTSSQWTTTYKKLPKKQKQPMSMRFLSWAAGAPRNATVVKKKTRDVPDDRSTYSGWSSGSYYFGEPDTQLYWVTSSDDRSYYSGSSSSGSSSSGRSSRSSRKGSSSRRKHFNGAVPNPMPPPPPGGFGPPMDGHFVPPPPQDHMGGDFGGGEFDGGFNPQPMGMGMGMGMPPPPPPPMNPPAPGGDAGFINLGQSQGHFHGAEVDDDYWSEND
ncbi:hypothetical protein AK830_g8714 [Neonectria ditissima]|uniref:Uncharacterized protein n=1 Tax=Neonectria ditissima TaxID=78410 RepID=A0A0P7BBM5_9HYPO|nr:hypothetical protein AK830_g8714 [Neonectria ditissima]